MLRRQSDRELFDAAFEVVILAPPPVEHRGPTVPGPRSAKNRNRRLTAALADSKQAGAPQEAVENHALLAASDRERLKHRDFEQMSAEEALAARELVRRAAS